jgi:3-methyladenine DNA glycosylase AlkD
MPAAKTVLAELKKKGKEKTRITYERHDIPKERSFGVSVADLKVVAKSIKGLQTLAYELYESGMMEAMYLAGMVANGAQMSTKLLDTWAEGSAAMSMIAEYTVAWVAVENPEARELALKWMKSKKEHVASSGWCTYSGLVATKEDKELDLAEIEGLLNTVVKDIGRAQGRERYTMNGFVISVGAYVKPLLKQAKAAAQKIGEVSVDMGDTDCKVPLATAYIAKIESMGRVGKKRKTIRC